MQRVKLKKDAVTWLYLNEEKISLKKLSGSELAEHFAGAVELLIDRKSREILAAGPSQEAIEKELPSHPEISKRKTAFYPGPVQSDISPAA